MPLNWDDPRIARWLHDAAQYTRYNLRLSQMILRFAACHFKPFTSPRCTLSANIRTFQ